MRFTHEDRFIIGLMALWGFVDAVAPQYHYILLFNIIMCIWVLYEAFITIRRDHNVTPTIISTAVGFMLFVSVYMAVVTNFTNVRWDFLLLVGVLYGLWVNYVSLKS
jgi:hypothetical protein